MSFYTKTFKVGQTPPDLPHFFVLNKGNNSGKPLKKPCPNCFVISANSEERKDFLYWLFFALWQAKAFHVELIGTAIPFIRKRNLLAVVNRALSNTDYEKVKKVVQAASAIEKYEQNLHKQLKQYKQLKVAMLRQKLGI